MKKAIARLKGRQCVEVEVNDDVKLGDPVPVKLSSSSEEVKLFPVIAFTGVPDKPVKEAQEPKKKGSFIWGMIKLMFRIIFILICLCMFAGVVLWAMQSFR